MIKKKGKCAHDRYIYYFHQCTKLLEKITTRKLYKCCYDAPDTSKHRNVAEVCNEKCEEKGMDSAVAVEVKPN